MLQHLSSIEIKTARYEESKEELHITAELLNGNPKKGDGVFLKDDYNFVEYAIVHQVDVGEDGLLTMILQFPSTPFYWKHYVDRLLQEGKTKVFCGLDIDEYLDLATSDQLDYLLAMTDFLTPDRIATFLQNHMRLSCKMIPIEQEGELSLTKFGGLPTLPADMPYPKDKTGHSLLFIGQVDLSEVAPHLSSIKAIGTEGILYLFGRIHQEEDLHQLHHIFAFYAPQDISLYEQKLPEDLSEYGSFREMSMMVFDEWNVPSNESSLWEGDPMTKTEDQSYIYFASILDTYNQFGGAKLLGHPNPIQGCVLMETILRKHKKAWYNPQGYNPDDYATITNPLLPETKEWKLLFELDAEDDYIRKLSNFKGVFNEGMDGRYYLMIREEDLEQLNFKNTLTVYQAT